MGREASTTYERVSNAIDELLAQGLKPSVRSIRTLVGSGSMNTINKYLQQWRETHVKEEEIRPRLLPPKLQHAVFEFIDQEVTRVHVELEEALSESRRDMQALAEDNEHVHTRLGALNAEIDSLANGNAILEGRISQLLSDLATEREEATMGRQNAELERIELAKANQRLEGLVLLDRELERLRSEFEQQRNARVQAEQEVAVLRTQKANLEERLVELKETRGYSGAFDGSVPGKDNAPRRQRTRPAVFGKTVAPMPGTEHDRGSASSGELGPTGSDETDGPSQIDLC